MTHHHTFRLFAIYLVGTLTISESPVSAFAVPRTRTTTLRSSYDLAGEGSALLGVRHDLIKIYNDKGSPRPFTSNIERQAPARTSANVLGGDRKSYRNNKNNNNLASSKISSLNPNESSTGGIQFDDINTVTTSDSKSWTPNLYGFKIKERVGNERKGSHDEGTTVNISTFNKNINNSRKRNKYTAQSESMTGEASSIATVKPSWKTYTIIERKPSTTVQRKPDQSTERSEELEKSETVTTNVTSETGNVASMTSLDELQSDTQPKTQVTRDITSISLYSSSPPTKKAESVVTQKDEDNLREISSTTDKTTAFMQEYSLSSKRGGFLDASIKKTATEAPTTPVYLDGLTTTENEIIVTKAETNEQNVMNNKGSAVPPQSQLVKDEIKEELSNYSKNLLKLQEDKNGTISDDSLSVKPISPKGALYTVSPNYRKMKKIEVQPLKPFIRDPDDNSWRNESLSLLGIVFKAKNASKPFTQVLKNKTEAELNNLTDKDDKNEVTDLRERLEKIAEVRKSRKKKVNKFGDTVYSDYEEATSSEVTSKPKIDTLPETASATQGQVVVSTSPSVITARLPESTTPMSVRNDTVTTKKPRKLNKFLEYYDVTDEYDADYILQPKIDLKKFTTRFQSKETASTPPSPLTTYATKSTSGYNFPDRKPTVQYFPPLPQNQKANGKENTDFFQKKANLNDFAVQPVDISRLSLSTRPTTTQNSRLVQQTVQSPVFPAEHKPSHLDNAYYITHPPRIAEPSNRHTTNNDETYNRATYVIKHIKDLIADAAKRDHDTSDVPSFTEPPLTGVTANEAAKSPIQPAPSDEYDYVANIRKDILNKFVENFNQNSERFKVDFPILYNNSVVHRTAGENGQVLASSTAFLKRLYETPLQSYLPRSCEPNCDLKVELSPAYELHYYVPEQEEKEVLEPKPATLPYTYRYPIL